MARLKKDATDEERRTRFLEELSASGNVTSAAKQANISRRTAYNWRNESEAFKEEWDRAADLGTDALEDEAIRRAQSGVLEAVYQGKEKVGTIRRFSDTLLIFLLKGRRPEKFRDFVSHRLAGDPTNSTPIPLQHSQLSPEQMLAEVRRIEMLALAQERAALPAGVIGQIDSHELNGLASNNGDGHEPGTNGDGHN